MGERYRVSVALCTHNGAEYIEEQLRSILAQTRLPDEVVLSDDASTDDTVVRAKGVWPESNSVGAVPQLHILSNQRALGVTKNFEQALLATDGEIIALCDQDDVWLPDRLERLIAQFDVQPDLTLVHSDARLVDDHGKPLGGNLSAAIGLSSWERRQIHSGSSLDVLLRRNVVTGATTVIRRQLLNDAVPFPDAWVHDEWLAMVASITGRMDFLPEALTDYRQHSSNQIGATKPTMREKVGRVFEPRGQRNRRLLERAQALETRLGDSPQVSETVRKLLTGKREHEQARSDLPNVRLLRIIPILRMALRGGYRRFGRAKYDIPRDLLQPNTAGNEHHDSKASTGKESDRG